MKETDGPAMRIGAWRIEAAREQISKDGTTVKLERRSMQLLLCLAEQPGRILSVEELLDRVWAGVVVTPDSVYHAVASLRRILGDDANEPTYITNIPRRGYSLIAPVAPWIEPLETAVDNLPIAAFEKTPASLGAVKTRPRSWWGAIGILLALILALGFLVIETRWPSKTDVVKPQSARVVRPRRSRRVRFPRNPSPFSPLLISARKRTSNISRMGWPRKS